MARGQCGHAVALVAIECRRCRRWFCRCRRCYRGHRYCGKRCRKAARTEQNDVARKRYIDKDPEAARDDNADRQRDHRRRQREPQQDVDEPQCADTEKPQQGRPDKTGVTDQGSPSPPRSLSTSTDDARVSGRTNGPRTRKPRGRQRCQRCGRWGEVLWWVRRFDRTPSFRRLL